MDKHFAIYQEYADNISAIKSDKNKIDHKKYTVPSEFEPQNLHVNETKPNNISQMKQK